VNYIVDNIEELVVALRDTEDGPPYFIPGHRLVMNNELKGKDRKTVAKNQKYPCFLLRMDIDEDVEDGVVKYTGINIAIVTFTTATRTTAQRLQLIKDTLVPLYDGFMEEVRKSPKFFWSGDQQLPRHKRILRPHWGKEGTEENESYLFDDPLDAIEIVDLQLNSLLKTC
jgi:hypothetical protein